MTLSSDFTVTRKQVVEAVRILGLDPGTVRSLYVSGDLVSVDMAERAENGDLEREPDGAVIVQTYLTQIVG